MEWTILENGDLKIWEDDPLILEEMRDQVSKVLSGESPYGLDHLLWEFLEPIICNSEFEYIHPEDIGALTASPIIGAVDRNVAGGIKEVIEAWWYPSYAIRGPEEDLANKGFCVWTKGV